MRPIRWFLVSSLACFAVLVAGNALAATAPEVSLKGTAEIAATQAAVGTPLDDLLRGRILPGFAPVLTDGVSVSAEKDKMVWLRLRVHLPEQASGNWIVRLNRQGIESLSAYFPEAQGRPVVAQAYSSGAAVVSSRRFPDNIDVPLPHGWRGDHVVFLEVAGQGYLNLSPQLLRADSAQSLDHSGERLFWITYLLLFAGIVLALLRQKLHPGARMLSTALWAGTLLMACLALNGHLGQVPGGAVLATVAPSLALGLFVMAAGQALWTTCLYAGIDKHQPEVAKASEMAGWALLLLGVAAMFTPSRFLGLLQLGVMGLWVTVGLVCLGGLATDIRRTRRVAMLIWCGLFLSFLAPILAYQQVLSLTQVGRVGYQLVLAVMTIAYVLVPWIRWLVKSREMQNRRPEFALSLEQKIAQAREQLLKGLESALRAATDGDLEWVAFRRLLEGLKPVLPQAASAVVATSYHGQDILLVEPKQAQERFAMLLSQRGSLLRNLSRSTAPQQIVIDFDGPEGPLERVQLAVIPLPIEKPGWGALLVERVLDAPYAESELDMCAEFASLATTAGEEAAISMEQRRAVEIDQEVGVYRREAIEPILRKNFDAAQLQHKPLSLLLFALDCFPKLPQEQRIRAMRAVAELVREQADHGQALGRMLEDELMLIVPDKQIGIARELAEQVCSKARKLSVADLPLVTFHLSIGVAQLQQGERTPQFLATRLTKALAKAREYGGNQVQSTDSAVL